MAGRPTKQQEKETRARELAYALEQWRASETEVLVLRDQIIEAKAEIARLKLLVEKSSE